MEFDYMEIEILKSAIRCYNTYQIENAKLNDFDDRFKSIAVANIEIANKIVEKLEEEQNKFYPTKLTS